MRIDQRSIARTRLAQASYERSIRQPELPRDHGQGWSIAIERDDLTNPPDQRVFSLKRIGDGLQLSDRRMKLVDIFERGSLG